jgi:hypothetical protein
MITALVQSVIRRLPNSLCPTRKNHGCKRSLLKVREGKYKREHGRYRWSLMAAKVHFPYPGAFKIYPNLWEGRNQVISI